MMRTGWSWLKRALLSLALVSPPALAQKTVEILIENYTFSPAEALVRPGDTVRWTNREKRTSHSVLFTGEGGYESERLFPQDSWQRTFSEAGAYSYTCGPHPEMKGLIVVRD